MSKIVLIMLLAAISASACGEPFTVKEAPFIGRNLSTKNMAAVVYERNYPIPPNSQGTPFSVPLMVAKNEVPVGYIGTVSGPSSVDKVVTVNVTFFNLDTKQLVPASANCRAGAKVITTMIYEVDRFGQEKVSCTWQEPYN